MNTTGGSPARPKTSKARASRRTVTASTANDNSSDIAADHPVPIEEATQVPGVVVLRVPGEQPGSEQIQVMPINGMDQLAIPTLLRVAIKVQEQQLGLAERS